jgi:hypothetical protein
MKVMADNPVAQPFCQPSHMRLHTFITSFALTLALFGCDTTARADVGDPSPLSRHELVGQWVGIETNGHAYFRMQLSEDGTGLLASHCIRCPLLAWKITKWTVNGRQLNMEFEVVTADTEKLVGKASTERLWMSDVITLTNEVPEKEHSSQVVVFRREREQSKILGDLKKWREEHAKKKSDG